MMPTPKWNPPLRKQERGSRGAWAILIIGTAAAALLFMPFLRGGCGDSMILRDTNRLRQIVGLAIPSDSMPMRDGAFDPYEFVRQGLIRREEIDLFRSERLEMHVTAEEVVRGDYTNFPWERYRAEVKPKGDCFLLLWEKKTDKHGGILVGLSDGTVKYLEGSEFKLRRIALAIVGTNELPMKDGAFDVYVFYRDGRLSRADLTLVRDDGSEVGPTDAEIARGDYTNFAWERYRGDGKITGPPVPVLWDKHPQDGSHTLLSDGMLR